MDKKKTALLQAAIKNTQRKSYLIVRFLTSFLDCFIVPLMVIGFVLMEAVQ